MNKFKMSLALIALMVPLLLYGKGRRIEMERLHNKHKSPIESFIPIEAFFDDYNKELTIEFAEDWEPVTIEIKSKEGYIAYRNLYMPHSNSTLTISLENIPVGIYELNISNKLVELAGNFIYER